MNGFNSVDGGKFYDSSRFQDLSHLDQFPIEFAVGVKHMGVTGNTRDPMYASETKRIDLLGWDCEFIDNMSAALWNFVFFHNAASVISKSLGCPIDIDIIGKTDILNARVNFRRNTESLWESVYRDFGRSNLCAYPGFYKGFIELDSVLYRQYLEEQALDTDDCITMFSDIVSSSRKLFSNMMVKSKYIG